MKPGLGFLRAGWKHEIKAVILRGCFKELRSFVQMAQELVNMWMGRPRFLGGGTPNE